MSLQASSLPQSTFGFFLASMSQGDVLPVAGSQGRLCLGGAIGRFVGPGQVQNSGAAGAFGLTIPLGAIPTPVGLVAGGIGDSWNFQGWYRDANPGATSNFTSAVRVTLQ